MLLDVSGTGGNDIWAVGQYEVRPHVPRYPLAAHWDGTAWRKVDVPIPPGKNNVSLNAVAAIAPDDAWAVGSAGTTGDLQETTLITHWDGASWQIVPSPNVGDTNTPNQLSAVAAAGPDDVWAVGYAAENTFRPIAQHWDGHAWTIVPLPAPETGHGVLSGVAVRASDDAWAVGYARSSTARSTTEPYVVHWDGHSWTRVQTPNSDASGTRLTDVAIAPSGQAYAVGATLWTTWEGGTTGKAAVMRYDGAHWDFVNVPSFNTEGTRVSDVTIAPDGDVWLTGSNVAGDSYARLSAGTWELVRGADVPSWSGPAEEALTMVAGRIWMVGRYYPSSNSYAQTYAERSPVLY
ncbi:MAG TPA: hypothetical protein VFV66_27330 [Nonomuraea sp.]|nr:hypothetical protein [Nonomuraea sp.]